LNEAAAWRVAARTVFLVFGLLLLLWTVVQLKQVVVQALLAVIFAAGMAPLVNGVAAFAAQERWRWHPPRALVVLVLYLTLIALLVLLGTFTIPPLLREIEELARRTPTYVSSLQLWLQTLVQTYPFLQPYATDEALSQQLQAVTSQLTALLGQALVLVRFALGILTGALNGIFILILALYMTADSSRIVNYLVGFLPAERQAQAHEVSTNIADRLGGWVRGQLTLSGIIGLVTFVGLSLLGVPYALLLALIAAVGEVIPMIGPIISAVPAILIAFIYSPVLGLLTLGLYVLIQQLENHLIVPKVMERAVSLHPLAVLLTLLAGSELMGVTGAILSVPVAAAISVIVDEVRRERLEGCEPGGGDRPSTA
jgi:predicted PurR-regulated permease PerM